MKKNLQDISEVSSVTELIERCDGMRKDGTCGNGCNVENHNKPCVGKKCPYRFGEYYHKTGGGYVQPNSQLIQAASTKAAVETAIAIVGGSTYQQRVSDQYAAIETAKDNLLRECVKFGALLTEVGYYLGEGRGHGECGGLQTWLEENCPEVNYNTAMGYKALAGKCVKMLGGGSQAVAVLQDKTEVVPPGEDAPIEVDSKFIEKRDELFNEVKSRRDLEQTYFKFMASEGRRGRPKGSGAAEVEYRKRSSLECAVEAVWPIVQHLLKHRGEMFTAYKILPDEKLIEMRQTLVEHEEAIASVLKTRVE